MKGHHAMGEDMSVRQLFFLVVRGMGSIVLDLSSHLTFLAFFWGGGHWRLLSLVREFLRMSLD